MIVWDKLRDTILDDFVKSLAACPPCPSSARELALVSARALGQAVVQLKTFYENIMFDFLIFVTLFFQIFFLTFFTAEIDGFSCHLCCNGFFPGNVHIALRVHNHLISNSSVWSNRRFPGLPGRWKHKAFNHPIENIAENSENN